MGWLQGLVRYVHCPYVFVSPTTQTRWVNPYKQLKRACKKVGIEIGFHDLRRFRCTQWLMSGVDVRTVQELMGHSDVQTTMRYAGYVSSHAISSICEAQRAEETKATQEENRRQQN
jgi:integrase